MGTQQEETTTPQNTIVNDSENQNDDSPPTSERPQTTASGVFTVRGGYTPLSDFDNDEETSFRNAYVMVSAGPDDSCDEDDVDDEYRKITGTFFVNPNAFTNSNRTEVSPAINSGIGDVNFNEIAASALSALDNEYAQTLTQASSASGNEKEDDPDVKIIAAGFEDRGAELRANCNQEDFIAQWEECDNDTSSGVLNQYNKQQRKKDFEIDTDAIRRAVKSLSIENKDASFLQKFTMWQEDQLLKIEKQDISPHELIPAREYHAFHKTTPTPESLSSSANLSRSATLADAIVRLSLTSSFQDDILLIDVVGVDHVECSTELAIQNTFRPCVGWLQDSFLKLQSSQKPRVHFRLIGRELSTTTAFESKVVDLLDSSQNKMPSLQATATCHSGVYHEFLEEEYQKGSSDIESWDVDLPKTIPDLVMAFNAGIWGYREWEATIQYLAKQKEAVPMVITAYTLHECQGDEEAISHSVESTVERRYRSKVLWEPERNPFGSQVIRETKGSEQAYHENAYWQAWLFGG